MNAFESASVDGNINDIEHLIYNPYQDICMVAMCDFVLEIQLQLQINGLPLDFASITQDAFLDWLTNSGNSSPTAKRLLAEIGSADKSVILAAIDEKVIQRTVNDVVDLLGYDSASIEQMVEYGKYMLAHDVKNLYEVCITSCRNIDRTPNQAICAIISDQTLAIMRSIVSCTEDMATLAFRMRAVSAALLSAQNRFGEDTQLEQDESVQIEDQILVQIKDLITKLKTLLVDVYSAKSDSDKKSIFRLMSNIPSDFFSKAADQIEMNAQYYSEVTSTKLLEIMTAPPLE